jgi:FixJ family two-component response regulator
MQSSTVFVVASEPAVLEVLTDLFKQAGLHSETFATAEAFLAECAPERPGCLLLDMPVSGGGGAELNRMLFQRQCFIPVIVLTGLSDARGAMEALKGGAMDFFVKPFDSGALLQGVKHAIEMDRTNRHILRLRAEIKERMAQLTRREREVMDSILESKSSREIAAHLNMSARTVEFHRARIMKKMEAISLVELVNMIATASGCHCIHKGKYWQGVMLSSGISPPLLEDQA